MLAVAGAITASVLVGVPQLQASRRDAARKAYVQTVYQAMEEYYKNNGHFPGCNLTTLPLNTCKLDAQRFLLTYLPDGEDPSTGQPYKTSSVVEGSNTGGWDFHTTSESAYFFGFLIQVTT